jgi:hypothetical protein
VTPGEAERIKLRANAIDRASTAALNAGVILPLAGAMLLPQRFAVVDVLANAYIWLVLAFVLHIAAQRVLRRLG